MNLYYYIFQNILKNIYITLCHRNERVDFLSLSFIYHQKMKLLEVYR